MSKDTKLKLEPSKRYSLPIFKMYIAAIQNSNGQKRNRLSILPDFRRGRNENAT